MNEIKYNNEKPEVFLNSEEYNTNGSIFYSSDRRPILLIQMSGGPAGQPFQYAWARDLPISTALKVVEAFKKTHRIIQICRQDQLIIPGIERVQHNFRALSVLISMADKLLLIDSFAQHVAAALGKPAVVCWIKTKILHFGYDIHTNIQSKPYKRPEGGMRSDNFHEYMSSEPIDFPFETQDHVFDADEIIKALHNTPKPKVAITKPLVKSVPKSVSLKSLKKGKK
jgi:hypothetical protein